MNKTLVAVTIAGAILASTAAKADTTLYGSAREELNWAKGKATGSQGAWAVVNNSRLGIKGSEDLGDGLKAVYRYEFYAPFGPSAGAADNSDSAPLGQRLGFVGLSGGFGQILLGRQWSTYYEGVTSSVDHFNLNFDGYSYTQGMSRLSNTLKYISPDFNGFKVTASVLADGTANPAKDGSSRNGVDRYQLALNYINGPLELGAALDEVPHGRYVASTQDLGDAHTWGVVAAYTFASALRVAALYEDSNYGASGGYASENYAPGVSGVTPSNAYGAKDYGVLVEYTFGSNIVRAQVGRRDASGTLYDVNGRRIDQNNFWEVGYQYNLSKRTRLWAEYVNDDLTQGRAVGKSAKGSAFDTGEKRLSLGMQVDF